jgi:hypothetical protein
MAETRLALPRKSHGWISSSPTFMIGQLKPQRTAIIANKSTAVRGMAGVVRCSVTVGLSVFPPPT